MERTEQTTNIDIAVDALYTSDSEWSLVTGNSWNGTDLHVRSGRTLRITQEDPEGDYWIGTLTRNGINERYATVSGNVDPFALAAIAKALWSA